MSAMRASSESSELCNGGLNRLLAEDAVLVIREKQVALSMLAAGFHPYHPAGVELTEALRQDLRADNV